ncbi:flocculation protein FLO11-like [Pseudomyrmex gracilis]|uniref:flocculation protein FLO11-like n=1 Tax=Pseudomyrmex gracilis TaxID=219809 RepID=UPI0009958FDE|nr:flocculation protein FLO11-like [Pseudomyrmex gracilis]
MSLEAEPREIIVEIPLPARVVCHRCHGSDQLSPTIRAGTFADPPHLFKHLKKDHPGDSIGYKCRFGGYKGKTRYPQKDVKIHIEKFHPQLPVDAKAGPSRIDSVTGAAPSSASSPAPTRNKNPPAKNPSITPRHHGARSTATAAKRVRPALRTPHSGPSPTSTPPTTSSAAGPSPTYAAVTAGQAAISTMRPPRAAAAGTVPQPGLSKGAVPKRASTRRTAAARRNMVAELSTPSSGGSSICIRRAGTSSLARRPSPPPSPSSAGSYTAREGGISRTSISPATTPSPQESSGTRRAHGALSRTSGAAKPVLAHPRSPKEGTARKSAEGVKRRRPSATHLPPQTTSERSSMERRTVLNAPVEKSSEATRRKFPLSLRRVRPGDGDRGSLSQGLQSIRVSPAKSSAGMPVSTSSGSPAASRPAAAALPRLGKASRGVSLPLLSIPSPTLVPAAGAPRIISDPSDGASRIASAVRANDVAARDRHYHHGDHHDVWELYYGNGSPTGGAQDTKPPPASETSVTVGGATHRLVARTLQQGILPGNGRGCVEPDKEKEDSTP